MFNANKLTIVDSEQENFSWDKATRVLTLMQRK